MSGGGALKAFSRLIIQVILSNNVYYKGLKRAILVMQYAFCRTFRVVKLATSQRPEECCESDQPHTQGDWNQEEEHAHSVGVFLFTLSAFSVTTIDEPDMASAAINGVTNPASAIGTAMML